MTGERFARALASRLKKSKDGDVLEASRLLQELAPHVEEGASGRENPMMLLTFLNRSIIAARTVHAGDVREALRLFAEMLSDRERLLGRDHEHTLMTRKAIAFATPQFGDAREALRLWAELLLDQERVLGRDHEDTFDTRSNVAICKRDVGETQEASKLFSELPPDHERALGVGHANSLGIVVISLIAPA